MVALSLYRGNLHRVPDIPRRWLMPTRSISFKDFKSLLNRRSKTLNRIHSSTAPIAAASTTSIPSPNPNLKENGIGIVIAPPLVEEDKGAGNRFGEGTSKSAVEEKVTFDCGGDSIVKAGDVSNSPPVVKQEVAEKGNEDLLSVDPLAETNSKADMLDDKEKRKKEVEEKLEVLNGKKHNLVQMLKQILNVEEELKRRNNTQGMTNRSPISPQVDISNDSGSMIRHPTPRMGSASQPNVGVDMEGRDHEDVSNHNNYPRLTHQTSSTSPSSESPLRKPPYIQHNMVLHQSRPSLGMTSSPSPSRFAPTGHLGPPPTVPTVSVSGTNYVASSPSPAASGGTSSFRDVRQPSPWN